MNFIQNVKKTIKEHDLIQPGDRIVIGVSGGADSVALLTALNTLKEEFNLTLVVCHINHKIRSGAAERDQKFVENLCYQLGIECFVKEAFVKQLAKEWRMSDEEAGRKIRYDFFAEIANGDKIATAHNQNDTVETVLMRIMRGTGLNGLTGIPYKRDNIIRPILDMSRAEIEAFLEEQNQEYMTDETNLEAIYTRNKIRLNLIPEIEREFNPNFKNTFSNNILSYQEDNACLEELATHFYTANCEVSINEFGVINIAKLSSQPRAIQKRVIMRLVKVVSGKEISSTLLNNLVDRLNSEVGTTIQINSDFVARIDYKNLVIEKVEEVNQNFTQIPVTLNTVISVADMKIQVTEVNEKTPIVNNGYTFYLPRELFNDRMCFRTRHSGDVLHVAHNTSKKVNRYFTDVKIAENIRNNYWLLTDGLWTVYWIPTVFGGRFKTRTGDFVKFEVLE